MKPEDDPVRHFRRDGSPCSLDEWARLQGDPANRLVAEDEVENRAGRWRVTTVWLGNDVERDCLGDEPEDGRPRIFGTLVWGWEAGAGFAPGGESRYATEAEARAGHAAKVAALAARGAGQTPIG